MSAGFRLNKEKYYDTPFGRYSFHYIPEAVFPWALSPEQELGYGFRLATKEKALCDTLYKIRGVSSRKAISDLLFEDLRMDSSELLALEWSTIKELVPLYHSTTLNTLLRWKEKEDRGIKKSTRCSAQTPWVPTSVQYMPSRK